MIAIVALAASHLQLLNNINHASSKVLAFTETESAQSESNKDISQSLSDLVESGDYNVSNIPNLNCQGQALYSSDTSDTFNPDNPYMTGFMVTSGSSNFFQDINGDNLADYIFALQLLSGSGEELESTYYGCVYLNTGTGWDKAYTCYARTRVHRITGNVIEADYRGDCADTSSRSETKE